jgi:hypothetical protein
MRAAKPVPVKTASEDSLRHEMFMTVDEARLCMLEIREIRLEQGRMVRDGLRQILMKLDERALRR